MNLFLESEEDQFNLVSIRLSITEFIEDSGISDESYCDQLGVHGDDGDQILATIVKNLY